jgi:hypothetical protein
MRRAPGRGGRSLTSITRCSRSSSVRPADLTIGDAPAGLAVVGENIFAGMAFGQLAVKLSLDPPPLRRSVVLTSMGGVDEPAGLGDHRAVAIPMGDDRPARDARFRSR